MLSQDRSNAMKSTNGESTVEAPKLKPTRKAPQSLAITIPKIDYRTMQITVVGKSPLIVHAWSAKAIRMMLDKQMGISSAGREKKNPLNDFRDSLYLLPNNAGYGIPAPAFKACIVSGANDVSMKMTECKRAIHVCSYTVPLQCPPLAKEHWTDWDHKHAKELKVEHQRGCSMRQDLVRLESGVADIRFRGCFPVWKCQLEVEYNARVLTAEQVVNLFQSGGLACGVGEWRPSSPVSRSGEFGRFTVE